MAGDWIPLRIDLHDDPAVIAIAGAVGLDEYAVVGRLTRLWAWANRHLRDGLATAITEQWVDRHLGAPGFAAAMLAAGWLRSESGRLEFPNFERWNSQGAKKRLGKTLQKQTERARQGGESVANLSPPAGDKPATERRPEKRRGKKREKTNPPSPPAGGTAAPETSPVVAVAEKPARPRNLTFDAVAEVTGADPVVSGAHVGKLAAMLAKAEPPYTPDDVREFGGRFHEFCPWAVGERDRPTIGEIEKHIGRLRAKPADPGAARSPPRRGGFETHDDRIMGMIADTLGGPT